MRNTSKNGAGRAARPIIRKFRALFSLCLFCLLFQVLLTGCGQTGAGRSDVTVIGPRVTSPLPSTGSEGEETARPDPPVPGTKRLSFVGCGDNITYYGNTRDARSLAKGERTYDFKPIFSEVAEAIASADVAFINQENVMASSYEISYYPMFNCPTDMGYDLKEIGFDVLNIATNHMLDKGAKGLEETVDFLRSLDLTLIGGYKSEEETLKIPVVEKNGIRVAFLAYTYATNGLSLPASSGMVIPYFDDDLIARQFEEAKKVSDVILVSAHWGDENIFTPNAMQKKYAQMFADLGALAIIGHHPHVVQPIERLTGKNGNVTLCVYSLGNFAAEMSEDYNMCGGMISFDIVLSGNDASLENVLFTPTVYTFTPAFYQNRVVRLENYTDEEARAHGISYYGKRTTLAKLTSYFTNTISAEWLPPFLKEST